MSRENGGAVGDGDASERAGPGSGIEFEPTYERLREIAERAMHGERKSHTLQATALVNEAWLKLSRERALPAEDRNTFLRMAARAIREILVDHARRRRSAAQGGNWQRITLTQDLVSAEHADLNVLDLEGALERLAKLNARQAQVVELRFFAGLSVEEAAAVLGLAPRTLVGDWKVARAWLARELKSDSKG